MSDRLLRSVLYVPADRPRAIAKAREVACDAVVIDLEDSIAPEGKEAARETMRSSVAEGRFDKPFAVRINGLDTPWATEDVLAAVAAGADAVLMTKVRVPEDIHQIADTLERADSKAEIWAMIETPRAILCVEEIAALADKSASPLKCLVLGTNDLALEMRATLTPDRAAFVPWFMKVIAAARTYGLDVLDGVLNDFRDEARFEAECRHGRMLGMDGKTLIHPAQIETANRVFGPSAEEIADARTVAAAFARPENAGKGVIGIEGRMVERLHLLAAERVLAHAEAIDRRNAP